MMETSAVYWEPKIKTYGFHEVFDLSLLEATVRTEEITLFGSFLRNLDDSEINFHLILMQTLKNHTTSICLVFEKKWEEKIKRNCDLKLQQDNENSFLISSPVELIYFFGPHFGERYGIADTTFRVLSENNISILAAGFSGSAVYLVLPENGIEKIRPVLSSAFEVPKSK
jgi:aspartokinase